MKIKLTGMAIVLSASLLNLGVAAKEATTAEKKENAKEFQNLNLNYDSLQKEIGSPTKLGRKSDNDLQNQKQMKAFQEKKLDQTINKIVVVEDCSGGKNSSEAKKCIDDKMKNR